MLLFIQQLTEIMLKFVSQLFPDLVGMNLSPKRSLLAGEASGDNEHPGSRNKDLRAGDWNTKKSINDKQILK